MNVNCGINGESRHVNQIFLCHHCGMPVCDEHGWVVAVDDAFAANSESSSALPAQAIAARFTLRTAESAPRPAMHCRDCVERFHKGAQRRHGWADPGPAAAAAAAARPGLARPR
ncbi:hypothetical protein [Asanoa siamensis]|uniref:Uncharacterized protein n=1 Tax=Asanoa siamensis TaxID=926357 RepID=A0ABQ4D4U3_9ACTN|nr:hypothetical protein [Asanoa siamensis]GIF78556.1 hypothetical protein Asi02nite_80740 [Asanoa siamensis]